MSEFKSLFIKVAGLQARNFIEKRPLDTGKHLRAHCENFKYTFFTEHLWWLLFYHLIAPRTSVILHASNFLT